MGIRVELFDTDIASVRTLVGSRDKRAVKDLKRRADSRDGFEAAKTLIMDGGYDHTDHAHLDGFLWLAILRSRAMTSRHSGFTGRSDYVDLGAWLHEVAGEPRLAELVAYLYRGRDLLSGAAGADDEYAEYWVGYLLLDEVSELLAGIERLGPQTDWRTELMHDELGPFLAELAAARRDLCCRAF